MHRLLRAYLRSTRAYSDLAYSNCMWLERYRPKQLCRVQVPVTLVNEAICQLQDCSAQDIPLFLTSLIPVESIDGYATGRKAVPNSLDIASGFEVRSVRLYHRLD